MSDSRPELTWRSLHPLAKAPRYATAGSAGLDLAAIEATTLAPGAFQAIGTGLALAIPPGYEGQVRPRSGLAARFGVTVLNAPGTLDSDYRGEVKVLLINHGSEPFSIQAGDRIAQLVLAEVARLPIRQVTQLDATERGEGGFGHTGR